MLIPTTAQFGRIDSENNHNNSPARNVELLLDGSLLPNVIYSDVAVGAFQHTQMNWRIVTCHAYARHKNQCLFTTCDSQNRVMNLMPKGLNVQYFLYFLLVKSDKMANLSLRWANKLNKRLVMAGGN